VTNETRARECLKDAGYTFEYSDHEDLIPFITSALTEAEERGRRRGLEEAAKVADEYSSGVEEHEMFHCACQGYIVEKIRALAKESK